jgi:hypothetical protein
MADKFNFNSNNSEINIAKDNGTIIINKNKKSYVKEVYENTDISNIKVKITNPKNNTYWPHSVQINGIVENISTDYDIWVVKEPHKKNYHPDRGPAHVEDNIWIANAYIGNKEYGANQGEHFPIHIVVVPNSVSAEYHKYLDNAARTNQYTGLSSLLGGEIKATITLIRKDN